MQNATHGRLDGMSTLVLDPAPAEFEAMLGRRRARGQDRHDEVWKGFYVMMPAPGGGALAGR